MNDKYVGTLLYCKSDERRKVHSLNGACSGKSWPIILMRSLHECLKK